MCPSGATCFPADCCFSELALLKIQLTQCVGLVQSGPHQVIESESELGLAVIVPVLMVGD
jgi:hypothetical protein